LPPIDSRDRITSHEAAELPETVALTDPPPAMYALSDGGRDTFCRDQ
jgi:hypothetical protein